MRPGRATRDIDFGIAVKSWKQFEALKERLIVTHQFVAAKGVQQRLIYTDKIDGFAVPVDLIPFRGIESANGTIAWPPGQDIVMNVAGFEEALESSVLIEIEEGLIVRAASVPGLTLLKLAAWADRLLEAVDFDMHLAGAELLGRDVTSICETRVLHQIRSILESEGNRERFAGG